MRTLDSKDVVDEFENLIDELVDPVLLRNSSNAAILVPEKVWMEMQRKAGIVSDN
jgi:hypothetical protein